MKHEQSLSIPTIRKQLSDIDTDSGLTPDDKKLLKQFYFTNCLPPFIQDVVRKYFPDDFTYDVLRGISEARAHGGDNSRGETQPNGSTEDESHSHTDGRSHSYTDGRSRSHGSRTWGGGATSRITRGGTFITPHDDENK